MPKWAPNSEPHGLMGREAPPEEKLEVSEGNGICEDKKMVLLKEAQSAVGTGGPRGPEHAQQEGDEDLGKKRVQDTGSEPRKYVCV